jgi:hypothetical protein
MTKTTKLLLLLLYVSFYSSFANAQGFLHADGKNIVNGNGDLFISRSIGTGNWMIQEGYMMQSTDAGINTQWEFTEKLVETVGQARTDSFYTAWLSNHFTRADVDSMKAWGFNAIRPALHYKWFTPPIEDEPVAGEITWINRGFEMVDSLIQWCSKNEMYVFLDMHGTPGGQGANADISDYNSAKPSLWESDLNKQKLVALWTKLAERYKEEPYVGGYDLINETNWTFSEANNKPLWDIFQELTTAIRTVDTNHIIILEGNWFANDYTGLPTLWDDNLVLSFHKYWTYNDAGSLDWMISLSDQRNVPLWLGESGENSNTWFTNLIALAESKNIGWSWWPVKKGGINNVMEVHVNPDYTNLISNWKNGSPSMTADEVYSAVMTFADRHKIENCFIHYDVIDAMMRQVYSTETKPFMSYSPSHPIYFTDYDLGRNNYAYFDSDTADYHGSTDSYVAWNAGYAYRNDGVDIEECTDTEENTNGFNVGWTADNEWMQYTINSDSVAAYTLKIRHASGNSSGTKFHFEANGVAITEIQQLPGTGGWQNWQTDTLSNVILPKGTVKVKFIIDQGGSNLSFFQFTEPTTTDAIDFKFVAAKSSTNGYQIFIDLNKAATTADENILASDFELLSDLQTIAITDVSKQVSPTTGLIITHETPIHSDNEISLSYNGNSVKAGEQNLLPFSNKSVVNNLPFSHALPGRIQAENFAVNNGLVLETCEDTGGGQNTGYSAAGDYLDYRVHVKQSGTFKVNFRVATERTNAQLVLLTGNGETFTPIDTISFASTGGWQKWTTQSSIIDLEEGYYFIRLLVKQSEHNLNWFELVTYNAIPETPKMELTIYPNPANETVQLISAGIQTGNVSIFNLIGEQIFTLPNFNTSNQLSVSMLQKGIYVLVFESKGQKSIEKLSIQ